MARGGDSAAQGGDGEAASGIGSGQSKRPQANRFDSTDSIPHHRVKSQKHIVGGGTRMYGRVPSSKALQKHHGLTSTTKLNRKAPGSLSPERGNGFGTGAAQTSSNLHHHRRATSELRLIGRDQSSTDLKKNTSQVSLKRNRSQPDVVFGKKNKSASNLHRSASNKAVDKLRLSGGSSKVQFKVGDEDDEEEVEEVDNEDEWVDASASASPLLSRRGSTISGTGQPADTPTKNRSHHNIQAALPTLLASPITAAAKPSTTTTSHQDDPAKDQSPPSNNELSHSLTRNTNHNQYLTTRILSRTPSHGAPPKMSTETALVRPVSPRQQSLAESSLEQSTQLQMRPGSSGGAELTSRFLEKNSTSQGHGSDTAGESFMRAVNTHKSGFTRAAASGKFEATIPRRPRSMGSLSHGEGTTNPNHAQPTGSEHIPPGGVLAPLHAYPHVLEDPNRTQQKLDLARESSGVEQTENPMGTRNTAVLGVFNPEKAPQEQPKVISRIVKRTNMIYDAVRMFQNPIARSINRVRQLEGMQQSGQQKQKEVTLSRTRSSVFNIDPATSSAMSSQPHDFRPVTPRSGTNLRTSESVASSLTEEAGGGIHGRFSTGPVEDSGDEREQEQQQQQGDSEQDVTRALLIKMWETRPVDLAASQE
ncbi:hypothetical protein QBC38DRAFT_410555 [Podospora fimiseda]|uniref:Uncharacterized protein n=1 Tax=Podospora fimiseda TaxID=252190 RepID=A0AAN7BV34_9PEZI|nr:hypothetical protein QBC38DRAFT_410555 [Podospora fimiseda]